MSAKSDDARARAEALFKKRKEPANDAAAEYMAAERARSERMRQLRELRLAREAQLALEKNQGRPD